MKDGVDALFRGFSCFHIHNPGTRKGNILSSFRARKDLLGLPRHPLLLDAQLRILQTYMTLSEKKDMGFLGVRFYFFSYDISSWMKRTLLNEAFLEGFLLPFFMNPFPFDEKRLGTRTCGGVDSPSSLSLFFPLPRGRAPTYTTLRRNGIATLRGLSIEIS